MCSLSYAIRNSFVAILIIINLLIFNPFFNLLNIQENNFLSRSKDELPNLMLAIFEGLNAYGKFARILMTIYDFKKFLI